MPHTAPNRGAHARSATPARAAKRQAAKPSTPSLTPGERRSEKARNTGEAPKTLQQPGANNPQPPQRGGGRLGPRGACPSVRPDPNQSDTPSGAHTQANGNIRRAAWHTQSLCLFILVLFDTRQRHSMPTPPAPSPLREQGSRARGLRASNDESGLPRPALFSLDLDWRWVLGYIRSPQRSIGACTVPPARANPLNWTSWHSQAFATRLRHCFPRARVSHFTGRACLQLERHIRKVIQVPL